MQLVNFLRQTLVGSLLMKNNRLILPFFCGAACMLSEMLLAAEIYNGQWVPFSFSQVNLSCIQTWQCITPPVVTQPGATIIDTPSTNTWGACAIGSSTNPRSCGSCIAPQPTNPCIRIVHPPPPLDNAMRYFRPDYYKFSRDFYYQ